MALLYRILNQLYCLCFWNESFVMRSSICPSSISLNLLNFIFFFFSIFSSSLSFVFSGTPFPPLLQLHPSPRNSILCISFYLFSCCNFFHFLLPRCTVGSIPPFPTWLSSYKFETSLKKNKKVTSAPPLLPPSHVVKSVFCMNTGLFVLCSQTKWNERDESERKKWYNNEGTRLLYLFFSNSRFMQV